VGCFVVSGDSSDEERYKFLFQISIGIWFGIQFLLALDGLRRRRKEHKKLNEYVEEVSLELSTEFIRTNDTEFLTYSVGAVRDNLIEKKISEVEIDGAT